jgi:hypothetical protein
VNRLKFKLTLICTIAMLTFLLPTYSMADNHAAEAVKLQFISDQKTVGASGDIHYHLVYEVPETTLGSNLTLQVEVPDGLLVPEDLHPYLDTNNRLITWELDALENSKAGVINFQLRASPSSSDGDVISLQAAMLIEGTTLKTSSEVTVTIGNEIHQPYFIGYPDGTFRPSSDLTRAETAAVVSRIENLKNGEPLANPYKDVPEEHWANSYINKVTHAGYMQGFDGEFRPNDPISRAEFVTIVLNIRGVDPVPLQAFDDTAGHWAESMIGTAEALNFIHSESAAFLPDTAIPRDESTQLLNIAFLRGQLVDGEVAVEQHFPDVAKDHPAFHWIEEASSVAHESVRSGIEERLIEYLPDQTDPF